MKYVLLVSSHNTRIQCELNKIASTVGKTRFKNGAIIRVSLSSSEVTIKIVDSGELANSELHKISENRPYYVSDCEAPEVFDKRERYHEPSKISKKTLAGLLGLNPKQYAFGTRFMKKKTNI